jgi:hypothetical protein
MLDRGCSAPSVFDQLLPAESYAPSFSGCDAIPRPVLGGRCRCSLLRSNPASLIRSDYHKDLVARDCKQKLDEALDLIAKESVRLQRAGLLDIVFADLELTGEVAGGVGNQIPTLGI